MFLPLQIEKDYQACLLQCIFNQVSNKEKTRISEYTHKNVYLPMSKIP